MFSEMSRNSMKRAIVYSLFLLFVLWQSDGHFVSAESKNKRIRFQITTIAEKNNERQTLAQTTVEGLPGTDFNINLQTGNFKMETRFLSDLITEDKLKIRATLNTRRFYGKSPINLPLYEEDSQKQTLEVGFNETIVLLPFGRNGGDETLKIEITPSLLNVSNDELMKPLEIKFDKQIPSGEIYIGANKIPHNYEVEAILLANGEKIASGKAECLFEEEKEIIMQPIINSNAQSFAAKVTVNEFNRSRPKDLVGINFSFYQRKSSNEILPLIEQGSGINTISEEFSYRLENENLPKNINYELRFRINLSKE